MVTVTNPDANNCGYDLLPSDNTFSNTCPFMINYHAPGTAAGIVPASTSKIVAGLYIARPPTTRFGGINLVTSVLAHPLGNCRLYYSQVTVDYQKSIDYVQRNRNKKIIYLNFVTDSWTNTTAGSSFNALVNSGIVHPTAILICPFIASVAHSGFGDFQGKSPFDTLVQFTRKV